MEEATWGFENSAEEETKGMAIFEQRMQAFDCDNSVTFAGTKEDIDAAMEYVSTQTSPFSFNKVVPIPEEIKTFNPSNIRPSFLAKHKAFDGYTFRKEHWTTPREAIEVTMTTIDMTPEDTERLYQSSKNQLTIEKVAAYKFKTCFSPPSGIYYHLSEKFPKLLFHYTFDIEAEDENTSGWALGQDGEIKNRAQYPTSFRQMKLHLDSFHETWLSLAEEDEDNN